MLYTDKKKVRDAVAHHLSPEHASALGLTLSQLQQVIFGGFHPDEATWVAMAARFQVKVSST
jgi:hypothetical protein